MLVKLRPSGWPSCEAFYQRLHYSIRWSEGRWQLFGKILLFAKVNATRDLRLRLQTRAFRRLAFTSANLTKRTYKLLPSRATHDKIALLLTMPEDRATLRSDPCAGMEVSRKGDAVASLFFRW